MDGLAGHEAAVQHEDDDDGVEGEGGVGEPEASRDGVVDPALGDPVGHDGVKPQAGGDRGALEVVRFARGVLGDRRRRHVEARQPCEAAQHEEGQAHVVQRRAHADREGHHGRGEAEGDLPMGKKLSVANFMPTWKRRGSWAGRHIV